MRLSCVSLAVAAAAVIGACGTARDLEESSISSCTRCHGFPPEQVSTGDPHPSNSNCVVCHSATVNADNEIIEGGAHANGQVDVSGHVIPFVNEHTTAALADIASCTTCHGTDYGGGSEAPSCTACHGGIGAGFADWTTNCSFCHGTRTAGLTGTPGALAAPPEAVDGTTDSTDPKVGAHQRHLVAGTYSDPLPCQSCHVVPQQTFPESLQHLDGSATIQFSALAVQGVASPGYASGTCSVYCHGSTSVVDPEPHLRGGTNTTPQWTSGQVACGSCHDVAQDTIQASGYHQFHATQQVPCESCHPGYAIGASPTVNLSTHVNGTFEASPINTSATFSSWPIACNDCH